jgi:hypothetical protein
VVLDLLTLSEINSILTDVGRQVGDTLQISANEQ